MYLFKTVKIMSKYKGYIQVVVPGSHFRFFIVTMYHFDIDISLTLCNFQTERAIEVWFYPYGEKNIPNFY